MLPDTQLACGTLHAGQGSPTVRLAAQTSLLHMPQGSRWVMFTLFLLGVDCNPMEFKLSVPAFKGARSRHGPSTPGTAEGVLNNSPPWR